MKYQLQYKDGSGWGQSRIHEEKNGELFDSLGSLLIAVEEHEQGISPYDKHRIRKIPEQPEEQVIE